MIEQVGTHWDWLAGFQFALARFPSQSEIQEIAWASAMVGRMEAFWKQPIKAIQNHPRYDQQGLNKKGLKRGRLNPFVPTNAVPLYKP